jgi:hypothetical protein
MNDQLIKDLARKAGLIAPYGSDREGLRDFDYRMFAELIVQECANVGERYADGNYEVYNQIMAHFGLEEPEE